MGSYAARHLASRLQPILCQRDRGADLPRNREPLFRAESRNALQLCSAGQPFYSLLFRGARFGMDRQSPRSSRWPGSGFYVQYLIGSRDFLPRGRSLEDKRRSALSASLEWRANRSQSQLESFRPASGRELFVLARVLSCRAKRTSLIIPLVASEQTPRDSSLRSE